MVARTYSAALQGISGLVVEIEADLEKKNDGTKILGLPDTAIREARERIRAAVRNSPEVEWPDRGVSIALSPASLPKSGSAFDVAMAMAVLGLSDQFPRSSMQRTLFYGELALDGRIRPVRGVLPAVLAARDAGFAEAIVAMESVNEASLIPGISVLGAQWLTEIFRYLTGRDGLREGPLPGARLAEPEVSSEDLGDVVGQPEAREALEIAAAGGHNLLLFGPPGTGKTMLAQRIIGLLPKLTPDEALEVTAVHSVAGVLPENVAMLTMPQFVAPHHSASIAGLVGGGSGMAGPGAVSLAHRGVLFIDEACEMPPVTLNALRTTLENGEVVLTRSKGLVRYPADYQLILATNQCPCAPARDIDCRCSPAARRKYFGRLSGPLLDRLDLHVSLRPVTSLHRDLDVHVESTEQVRGRVLAARERAKERFSKLELGFSTNAEIPGSMLRTDFLAAADGVQLLEDALRDGRISARGADRCLRVAWTLADVDCADRPMKKHVIGALDYRDRSQA
jgi:magnesium chelatase family protein